MFSRRMIVVSLIFLGLLALIPVATRLFYVPWSQTNAVSQYRGRYFRMIVKLEYHGEPQLFDMVVGCNVRSSLYQDNSRSRDVGLVPDVYGRRMKDNKAVVVRPPDVCDGEVSDTGEVPPGFMPLIVVYDNADTLDQGLAYLSDDAYASPHSDMKFGSAEIHAATEAEFKEFMDHGVPNLVTREMYWSLQSTEVIQKQGLKAIEPTFAGDCYYAEHYSLPIKARDVARQYWPADHPRYWFAKSWPDLKKIVDIIWMGDKTGDLDFWIPVEKPWGRIKKARLRAADVNVGMARRHVPFAIVPIYQMKFSSRNDDFPIAEYYPYFTGLPLRRDFPDNRGNWASFLSSMEGSVVKRIDVEGGDWRGFAACIGRIAFERQGLAAEEAKRVAENYIRLKGAFQVDNSVADHSGTLITSVGGRAEEGLILEKDEAIFDLRHFGIGSYEGDVK